MTVYRHVHDALSTALVNAGEVIALLARAEREVRTSVRLEQLYDAQQLINKMAVGIGDAVTVELANSGAAAVPLIAGRMRVVAAEKNR